MDFIAPYLNYIIIVIVVIAALIGLSMFMRTYGGRVRGRRGKRLGVSEFRELDKSRRLMLVRRDNVEHLILVGGGQSLVIEQNIRQSDESVFASPPVAHHRETPPPLAAAVVATAPEQAPTPVLSNEPEIPLEAPVMGQQQTYEPEPEFEAEFETEFEPEQIHRPAPRAPEFTDRAPNVRPVHREPPMFNNGDKY